MIEEGKTDILARTYWKVVMGIKFRGMKTVRILMGRGDFLLQIKVKTRLCEMSRQLPSWLVTITDSPNSISPRINSGLRQAFPFKVIISTDSVLIAQGKITDSVKTKIASMRNNFIVYVKVTKKRNDVLSKLHRFEVEICEELQFHRNNPLPSLIITYLTTDHL